MIVHIHPQTFGGTVTAPPSKSAAHRALICAALAAGESRLHNIALSADIAATIGVLRQLGAEISTPKNGTVTVRGVARAQFAAPAEAVFCNESGSTLRFCIPLFSLTNKPVRFTGAGRLMQRPQQVYAELFREKGLAFAQSESDIAINGALAAGEYTLRGDVSSQFITGLLLALSLCEGDSTLRITPPFESRSYVDMTLGAMADFGVQAFFRKAEADGTVVLHIPGGQAYTAREYTVEGDYSNAAFWAVAGAVRGGITLHGLRTPTRQGDSAVLHVLRRCGAAMAQTENGLCFTAAPLHAAQSSLADCPDLGPILMVLALFCTGESTLRDAGRLRVKESDRIAAMQEEIAKLGGRICCAADDTLTIAGTSLHGSDALHGHNDHRIAMALCIAAVCAGVDITLHDAQCVQKSYPNFYNDLRFLGVEVTKIDR